MPCVTLPAKSIDCGLPIASTFSPILTWSELPKVAAGRSSASTLTTARSVLLSEPTSPPLIGGAVAQLHGDPLRALDHMRVGHDVAVLADDDPAAHALGLVVLVVHIGGDRHDGGETFSMISSLDSLPPGSDSPADCGLSCSVMPGRSSAGTFSVGPLSDAGRSSRVLPHAAVDPDARQRHQRHHQHRRQNDPENHQALVAAARLGLGRLLVVGDVPLVGVPALRAAPSGRCQPAARRILVGGQVLRRLLPPLSSVPAAPRS